MSDTHQTHLNAFKRDVDEAHQAALGAVDELKRCIDALEAKYRSLLAELRPGGQDSPQDEGQNSEEDPSLKRSDRKLTVPAGNPNA
jgi:hypothetical protein